MKPVREKIGSGRDVTEREKASLTMFCNYKPNLCVVAHPFKSQETKTIKKNQERCKKRLLQKANRFLRDSYSLNTRSNFIPFDFVEK